MQVKGYFSRVFSILLISFEKSTSVFFIVFILLRSLFAKVRPAIIRALFLSFILSSSYSIRFAALIRLFFSLGGHAIVKSLPKILSDTVSTLLILAFFKFFQDELLLFYEELYLSSNLFLF
jgi:hypothetical protein